jgi:hypothetical protein
MERNFLVELATDGRGSVRMNLAGKVQMTLVYGFLFSALVAGRATHLEKPCFFSRIFQQIDSLEAFVAKRFASM